MDTMLVRLLDQHAPEMASILKRLGIDRDEVLLRDPGLTTAAIKACMCCPNKAICRAWQESRDDFREAPEFCRDAVVFHNWCLKEHLASWLEVRRRAAAHMFCEDLERLLGLLAPVAIRPPGLLGPA